MKVISSIGFVALTLSASAEVGQPPKPVVRKAVTNEQLSQALRKAAQNDPMDKLQQSKGADSSKENQPKNLLEQSDIICFGGVATLVPKRAILSAPVKLKERLTLQPGARIVGWADFYAANRGWITTVEVSRIQAEGNQPIAEKTQESIAKSTNLVVATYSGGPISVLPLKEPEDASKTEKAKP